MRKTICDNCGREFEKGIYLCCPNISADFCTISCLKKSIGEMDD